MLKMVIFLTCQTFFGNPIHHHSWFYIIIHDHIFLYVIHYYTPYLILHDPPTPPTLSGISLGIPGPENPSPAESRWFGSPFWAISHCKTWPAIGHDPWAPFPMAFSWWRNQMCWIYAGYTWLKLDFYAFFDQTVRFMLAAQRLTLLHVFVSIKL